MPMVIMRMPAAANVTAMAPGCLRERNTCVSFRRDENWILAIDRYPQVEQRLRELHPYELPAIYSLRPEQALPAFASWVQQP